MICSENIHAREREMELTGVREWQRRMCECAGNNDNMHVWESMVRIHASN